MPEIPGLPSDLLASPGVEMTPPPVTILRDVTKIVTEATKELQPHENGALVWVATTKGVNIAVVHRVGERFAITGWIAKEWDHPLSAGIAGSLRW